MNIPGLMLVACSGVAGDWPFEATPVASLDQPWAMAFLPDGRLLVTEKPGRLLMVSTSGEAPVEVTGVPPVDYGGQGGLGDVALHPQFANNALVYLSYAEAGEADTRGAAVAHARLVLGNDSASLQDLVVIWRQVPKVSGRGHYGHRLLFDADGFLFVSSGERQKFDPAQDMGSNLGKILRLHDDGTVPDNNPFAAQGGIAAQVWSLGHRNPLGLAFDAQGQLWSTEMGPRHGDELNRVVRGGNFGYPLVSNGDHYSGETIPDHDTRPDLAAPALWWKPTIAPAGLAFYDGKLLPEWQGSAFIPALAGMAMVRVGFQGEMAFEAERFDMEQRIRAVEQGPDGALWLLEDGAPGRLLRLAPRP